MSRLEEHPLIIAAEEYLDRESKEKTPFVLAVKSEEWGNQVGTIGNFNYEDGLDLFQAVAAYTARKIKESFPDKEQADVCSFTVKLLLPALCRVVATEFSAEILNKILWDEEEKE